MIFDFYKVEFTAEELNCARQKCFDCKILPADVN